jgi:uncharacterized protein YneR
MIEITLAADQLLKEYLQNKKIQSIRLSLSIGGCGIRFFSVAVDKPRESDAQLTVNGHVFIIEDDLLYEYGPIKIDSDIFSFRISGGGIHPPNGCGTCPFGCSIRTKISCDGDCLSCKTPCISGQRTLARKKRYAYYMQ